jgi:hypothetical protein
MATLGKTDIGGTSGPMSPNNEWAAGPYTAIENGTITSISVYAASVGGGSTRFGVWKDDGTGNPGDLIAESASSTLASGWMTFSASGTIVSGQAYYIGHLSNNNIGGAYAAGSKEIVFKAKTFGALSNPFPGGTTTVGSRDYSMYFTYTPTPSEEITIATPVTKQLIQRNPGEETADIEITGTLVGADGDIEARFAGGDWQTITNISSEGAYSGTLTGQALTAGTLEVRSVDEPSITASVANVMTGRLYGITGDSIAEGRLVNAQNRNSVDAVAFRQDDAWVFADDPMDSTLATYYSHWPLLAQHLTQAFGCPVGFITTATGSQDIAGGSTAYAKPNSSWTMFTGQIAQAAPNGIEALLVHLGPNAGVGDTLTQAQYLAALTTWAADIRADVQANVPIYLGVFGRSNATTAANPKIRRAIAEAIKNRVFTCGPNYLGPNWADGVHPRTDGEAAIAAGRWFVALSGVRAPRIVRAELRPTKTEVDLVTSGSLGGSNGDTYTASLFTVNGTTPTSATRVASNRIRLVFATDRALGQTFVYVPGEEHIGATMPKSPSVILPYMIHGVDTEAQPADPCSGLLRPVDSGQSAIAHSTSKPVARAATRALTG